MSTIKVRRGHRRQLGRRQPGAHRWRACARPHGQTAQGRRRHDAVGVTAFGRPDRGLCPPPGDERRSRKLALRSDHDERVGVLHRPSSRHRRGEQQTVGTDGTVGNFAQSDDWGVTWNRTKGMPADVANTNLRNCVRFGSSMYLAAKTTADLRWNIFKAPLTEQATAAVWTKVHTMNADASPNLSRNLAAGSQYLYLCEYQHDGGTDPVGGPEIFRSADGVTWTSCYGPNPAILHFHAIAEDPYNPGHIYCTAGDGASPVSLLRSNRPRCHLDHDRRFDPVRPVSDLATT